MGPLFGSCLQKIKQFEYHIIISLPFWDGYFFFALLWYLSFYFLPPFLLPSPKNVRTDLMDVRADGLDLSVLGFYESCSKAACAG